FIYDIGLVSIGMGLGFILFFGPAIYPGGNLFIATILAGIAMLCVGLGMITWTVTIPRSGGIYCFGTRSMWPPFAFTLSFVEASAWIFYGAFGAFYLTQLGLAPAITTIGIITGSSGMVNFGTSTVGQSVLLSNWAFLPLIGAAFSISIGGEIKQVTRGQSLGILGAILWSVVVWVVAYVLVYRSMGSDCLGAVTYSSLNGVKGAA